MRDYKRDGKIKEYDFFDRKKIESRFFDVGLAKIARRYFPDSYVKLRPLQKLIGDYIPLECEICSKDVLAESVKSPYQANLIVACSMDAPKQKTSVSAVCKGDCDRILQARLAHKGEMSMWEDIGDLINPVLFLKSMMSYMNELHAGHSTYSAEAHDQLKRVYIAIAQRTLRDVTEEDAERFKDSLLWEGL